MAGIEKGDIMNYLNIFKHKYFLILWVFFVVVIGVFLLIFKYSRAIYVKNDDWASNYSSSSLYIASDLLSDDNRGSFRMLSYDTNPINFSVFNYESDNQISKFDLVYDLTCTATSGYECYIDGVSGGVTNQTLEKNFTCSIPNLTEEQCKSNASATITYNKHQKNHSITVKSSSSSISAGTCDVNVNLSLKKPYSRNLSASLSLTFNPDEQDLVIDLVKDYGYKCEYNITNYSNSHSCFLLRINDTYNQYAKFSNTLYDILYIRPKKYETIKSFIVYKAVDYSCDNLFSYSYSSSCV